ncbi:MAG: hypothetical protein V3V61_05825 [Gammaproteobacteria bacterium]
MKKNISNKDTSERLRLLKNKDHIIVINSMAKVTRGLPGYFYETAFRPRSYG